MANITFIQPCVGRKPGIKTYPSSWTMEPLSIASIAALTPAWQHNRKFYDDRFEKIPFDEPTDLVCITCETYTARRAYQIADEYLKRSIPVVIGGFHPTFCPDEAAQHSTSVVIGEAEFCWNEILKDATMGKLKSRYKAQKQNLKGVLADRSIFKPGRYGRISLVETSRGCTFACEFCSISAFFEKTCRERPIEEVVAEIRSLHGIVFFVDDNIGTNPTRLRELCEALIPLKRQWIGQVSLHIAKDHELLSLMRKSGCEGVLIGFESLDTENLKTMGKTVNRQAQDYESAIKNFRTYGLSIYATFVFGYDNDTEETLKKTFEFALKSKFFFTAFNHLVPFPNTPLYNRLKSEKRLLWESWWLRPEAQFGEVVFKPKHFAPKELAHLCEKYRHKFYTLRSTLRRTELSANGRTPTKLLLFLAYNLWSNRQITERQGLPLGLV